MDIRCPVCGEPWDADCIHERVEECYPDRPWPSGKDYKQEVYDIYYKPILHDFQSRGCKALGYDHSEEPDKDAALLSSMLIDILGDDIDGVASELDDAEYLGLI